MSGDSKSHENGLANQQRKLKEGSGRWQKDINLDMIQDRFLDKNNFPWSQFSSDKMAINVVPVVNQLRENGASETIRRSFFPVDPAFTPFADAGKGYFLDSDLETIEEESSVVDSDIDEHSSAAYDLKQSSQECNHSISSSTESSVQEILERNGPSSARVSDGGQSSSALSSESRSPPPNPGDQSSTINGFTEKRNRIISDAGMYDNQNKPAIRGIKVGAIDPNFHQKIVYAKCMSPKEGRQSAQHSSIRPEGICAPTSPEYNLVASPFGTSYSGNDTGDVVSTSDHRMKSVDLTIAEMFEAARRGDLSTLKQFSTTEQNETVDEQGNTVLHVSASAGQLECVKYLYQGLCAESVSLLNDDRMSPTALSVQYGHLCCVQWLIENTAAKEELIVSSKQASIDGANIRPPLAHIAARFNQNAVLDWLCERMSRENFSVDSADHFSNTAVHEAATHGHLKSLQTLVGRGASVTVLNSNGDTPGQVADKNCHDLCVGYLVVVETCMSLAQQLITIKLENEGLRRDNNSLRIQVQAMHKAKLAYAKESVEEHFRDTLQRLSSYEEGNEDRLASSFGHSSREDSQPKQTAIPKCIPAVNTSTRIHADDDSCKLKSSVPPIDTKMDRSLQMSTRFAVSKNSVNKLPNGSHDSQVYAGVGPKKESKESFDTSNTTSSPTAKGKAGCLQPSKTQERSTEEGGVHSEMCNINQGTVHEHCELATSKSLPAKAWEKMALDEVIRLARDSRYLPSPTISMCTEDSTMETREVMKDRLTEASRWFLVQQSGQSPIKNSIVPTQRMRPLYNGGTAFTRPSQRPVNNSALREQKSKYDASAIRIAQMQQPKLSLPQNFVAATNQQYQALQRRKAVPEPTNDTAKTYSQGSTTSSNVMTHSPSSGGELNYSSVTRPTSAKSSSSTTSTIKSDASKSTARSKDNAVLGRQNFRKYESPGQDPLQKRRMNPGSPGLSAPGSRPSSGRTSTNTIRKFDIPNNETAEVRVALPTRNNSFLRKVQPHQAESSTCANCMDITPTTGISYSLITPKFPSKRGTNSSTNLKSLPLAFRDQTSQHQPTVELGAVGTSVNGHHLTSPQKASNMTSVNVIWKTTSKPSVTQGLMSEPVSTTVNDNSERSTVEKSKKTKTLSKPPYGGLFSSDSPRTAGKRKTAKLFHF